MASLAKLYFKIIYWLEEHHIRIPIVLFLDIPFITLALENVAATLNTKVLRIRIYNVLLESRVFRMSA